MASLSCIVNIGWEKHKHEVGSTDENEHVSYECPGQRWRVVERDGEMRAGDDKGLPPVKRVMSHDVNLRYHPRPLWSRTGFMAVGGTVHASEIGMPLLCMRVTRRKPIRLD